MSNSNNQTSLNKDSNGSQFPVAAIVCLSVGGYVILVISFLIIRRMMMSKGSYQPDCCCPENGAYCSLCGKINEQCPSFCDCTGMKSCWIAICSTQKETSCKDIFCISCVSMEGCCEPQSGLNQRRLCCCSCQSNECCIDEPYCTSCFDSNLDPDSCGFLCLEIKLRSSQRRGSQRSSSAPAKGTQNQSSISTKPPDKAIDREHENAYHISDQLDESTRQKKQGKHQIGVSSNPERQRSSSHSPNKTESKYYQMASNKSNNSSNSGILSTNTQNRHSHSNSKNNNHVNFHEAFDDPHSESETLHYLPYSSTLSSSFSKDSSQDISFRTLSNKTSSTDSGKSTSRSRKVIRPGQMSQRFPNKILVSSESLKFNNARMNSTGPEVSYTQNSNQSLPNISINFDGLNFHRPLPSLRKPMKSLT